MKKAEFVEALAAKLEMPKQAAVAMVDTFNELIMQVLKKGDEVVMDIGKFILKSKPAREAKNPATGAIVKVPAKVVPQFKPSKKFKEGVLS